MQLSPAKGLRGLVPFEYGLGEVNVRQVPEGGNQDVRQVLGGARDTEGTADPGGGLLPQLESPTGPSALRGVGEHRGHARGAAHRILKPECGQGRPPP